MYKMKDPLYDDAIVGIPADGRAIYSPADLVAILEEHDGMTEEDASEFVEHNVLRDVAHMGANSPIILYGRDEITDLSDAPEDIKMEIIANDERLRKKGMEEKKC